MLPPEFINKIYGVGSYVFVNCSDEFSGYFLLAGYNVTDIQDLSATVYDENNYDFMIINYSVPVDEIAFNESLCKYLQSLISLKKLLIFADKETQKSPQFIKLKSKFESIGFGYDDVIATLIGSSFDDQLYIPLVSLNLATKKDNSLKKENNIAELVQYVRPNENVCVIYEDCNYFSTFINQYSLTREIKKFKNVESFTKASKFINDIQKQTDRKKRKYFDCIYLLNDENDITDLDALRDFSENLCPGGRIIFKSNDFQDFTPGKLFELEIAYMSKDHQLSANVCGCDIIDKDLNGYFVAMKDPLIDVENFEYVEKTYSYSSPPKNLIMFERDYYNPWLLKAIVEFPTRNRNKFALKRYAEKILQEYDSALPDFAAAIAILGYQSFSDKNNIPIIIKRIENYITNVDKLRKKSPHQLRWLISLAVLGAELSKNINNKHDALKLYLSAIKYPFNKFSPTIGTKVLQAYYNIAMILYTSGDRINFGKYLSEALVKGVDILNVSYKELLGNDQKPLVFTLFIYHDIIDWLIKIVNLKNNLGLHDNIIPSLNDKAWSNLLKERMDAIISMNGMIKERDNAINDQGNMLEERMKGINELESVIQAQQKLIEERWEAMQEMEKMIIERDNTISELKNLI